MKQKLLLAALLLGSSVAASAQWTFPEPETTPFSIVAGTYSTDTMYLYNVGAKLYFTEGNDWGTRASTANSGLKVYFEEYIEDAEDPNWDGQTYLIWDFSLAKNGWRNLFIDNPTSMYVDHGSQGSFCWHFFIENNGSTFRIYAADDNTQYNHEAYPGSYVGIKEFLNGTMDKIISPLLEPEGIDVETEKAYHIDWALVSKEAYEKQQALVPTYEAAMALKAKLDEIAKNASTLDVSAETAVFNNTNSTVDELKAALASADKKYSDYLGTQASPSKPVSMDELVGNTTFDENHDGWTSNTGCQNNLIATNQCSVAGPDGNFYFTTAFWENWNGSPFKGKMYTEVTPVPAGVYRLELAAFANGGSGAYVYLNNDSVEVTTGGNPYKYEVISIVNSDTIEIGLKEVTGQSNWIGIDNCHLTYYGNSTASYQYLMAENVASHVIPENAHYQFAAKEAYDAVVAATAGPTTIDDAIAKLKQLNEAWATFGANLAAYQALAKACDEANATIEEGFEAYDVMNDFVMEVPDMLREGTMSTEEAQKNADDLYEMIKIARTMLQVDDPVLVFTNMNFDDGNKGWLVDTQSVANATSAAPAPGGNAKNPNAERWQDNFDYYQVAEGLPNGVYQLKAQAFYRTGDNAVAESGWKTDEIFAWIYVNGTQKAIHNIMDFWATEEELKAIIPEGNILSDNNGTYQRTDDPAGDGSTVYTTNGMNCSSAFFIRGDYENEVYGIVTDGKLRIGIKSEGTAGNRWTLFDNFRVFYKGYNEDILSQILEEKIADAEALAETAMAAPTKDALNATINAGRTALNGSGDDMFAAIQTFDEAMDAAKASAKLYEDLAAVLDELVTAIDLATEEGTGSNEAFDAADEMSNAIGEALEDYTWSDEEVQAKIDETKAIISELKKPAEIPTDENPVDYTRYITNPTFDTIGDFTGWTANGSSGWGAGGTTGPSAERFQMNFDSFQDISVPAGIYELSVNGYHRSGSAEKDWTDYQAQQEALATDPNFIDETLTAFLYATTSEGTFSVALPHASAGYCEGGYGVDSESRVGSDYYIPNSMNAADTYFHTPKVDDQGNEYYPYFVSVIIKVGEDQKLRIGVKRDATGGDPSGNWSIVDDFQLIAYGTESSKAVSGDASGIETIAVAEKGIANQYFTVSGARTNSLQKGINIVKKVNADGTVTVSKVLVK